MSLVIIGRDDGLQPRGQTQRHYVSRLRFVRGDPSQVDKPILQVNAALSRGLVCDENPLALPEQNEGESVSPYPPVLLSKTWAILETHFGGLGSSVIRIHPLSLSKTKVNLFPFHDLNMTGSNVHQY